MIKTIKLTLSLTTPIFMGDSNSRQLASEIRVPSIRGQLRYWLRAALGGKFGSDIAALLKREDQLMGSTGAGSMIRLRVYENPRRPLATAPRAMLPHRQARSRNALSNEAFVEGGTIQLNVNLRPGLSELPEELAAALLLWLNFGGLGKRSRRGFGSLKINKFEDESNIVSVEAQKLFSTIPQTTAELKTHLTAILNFANLGTGQINLPQHPILHPTHTSVVVCEGTAANVNTPRYHEAMVPFWTNALRANHIRDEYAFGYTDRGDRLASPVHLHIAKTNEGHHLVLTSFWQKSSCKGKKVSQLL
ncbi:MAG: type III-B CRISPR module RAMP protein Cmr1, partial [Chloroflexota bacterium]